MSRYTAVPLVSTHSHFPPSRWWALLCTTVNKTSVEDCNMSHLHQPPPPARAFFQTLPYAGRVLDFFFLFQFSCLTRWYYLIVLKTLCKVTEWLMSVIIAQFEHLKLDGVFFFCCLFVQYTIRKDRKKRKIQWLKTANFRSPEPENDAWNAWSATKSVNQCLTETRNS